jgi:heme exporter protein D
MNWEDFFAMGGYAFYVWTAYGLMAAVLILNLVLPLRRRAGLQSDFARRMRREGGQS